MSVFISWSGADRDIKNSLTARLDLEDIPYTERFAMQLNHISDANCVARKQNLENTAGFDILIRRIRFLLKRRQDGIPEKPYDVLMPKVAGRPVSTGGYFVKDSRNEVIEEIDKAFGHSNIVILSEIFGFGKKSVIRNTYRNTASNP